MISSISPNFCLVTQYQGLELTLKSTCKVLPVRFFPLANWWDYMFGRCAWFLLAKVCQLIFFLLADYQNNLHFASLQVLISSPVNTLHTFWWCRSKGTFLLITDCVVNTFLFSYWFISMCSKGKWERFLFHLYFNLISFKGTKYRLRSKQYKITQKWTAVLLCYLLVTCIFSSVGRRRVNMGCVASVGRVGGPSTSCCVHLSHIHP